MKLNDLKPNEGAKKTRKRKGHGPSAGQGKTAGRGTKGQGSRSGGSSRLHQQGGNLPYFRRLPFIRGEGFTPPFQVEYTEVSLSQLAVFAAGTEITPVQLADAAIIRKPTANVVILGNGDISVPLTVRVQRVTQSAKAKIEAAGGSVETI